MQLLGPRRPVVRARPACKQAAAREAAANPEAEAPAAAPVDDTPAVAQVVRSEHEKIGRNQPCYCGSGKKFKLCHGK